MSLLAGVGTAFHFRQCIASTRLSRSVLNSSRVIVQISTHHESSVSSSRSRPSWTFYDQLLSPPRLSWIRTRCSSVPFSLNISLDRRVNDGGLNASMISSAINTSIFYTVITSIVLGMLYPLNSVFHTACFIDYRASCSSIDVCCCCC